MNYGLMDEPRKQNRWIRWVSLGVILLLIAVGVWLALRTVRQPGSGLKATRLRCVAGQDVTPFGNNVLYYDGMTLYCLSTEGAERWSYSLGSGAGFDAGSNCVAAWVDNQLYIIDRNGKATYNDHLSGTVQFARAGTKYVAAVLGDGFSPTVLIKDLVGLTVDDKSLAYEEKAVLDVGFFLDGEYMYAITLDTYSTVAENTLYTIRVGQMNTGELALGEPLTYAVRYASGKLYVISTQEMKVCDYHCTVDRNATKLTYGWYLVDWREGSGSAELLFAPSRQLNEGGGLTELRLLRGSEDKRMTLPSACVGGGLYRGRVYAFSSDSVYRASYGDKRFTPVGLNLPRAVTGYLGMTDNGVALLSCGEEVYAVPLP